VDISICLPRDNLDQCNSQPPSSPKAASPGSAPPGNDASGVESVDMADAQGAILRECFECCKKNAEFSE